MNKPLSGRRVGPGRGSGTDVTPVDHVPADLSPASRQITGRAADRPIGSWPDAAPYADALIEASHRRRRRILTRLALFVGMPTLATALFVIVVAPPRYSAHAEMTYQIYRPPSSLASGLAQSFSGTSENNSIDLGAIVIEFVRSDAILRRLSRTLPLRQAFSDPHLDWFSRLRPNANETELLSGYRSRVSAREGLGGYVTLDVTTANPALSLQLAQAIVSACNDMVDGMTVRARDDEMAFAQSEVAREEDRVRRARIAMTEFQNAHGEDPDRAASQLSSIVGTLESDLAAARTQLAESSAFLRPNAPALQQLRARITSLQSQLDAEKARLAGPDGNTYSRLLADYARLQLDEEFARTAYTQAEQGLAVARADAARQQNYLVDFVEPSLPDSPDWRAPARMVASVFLAALLATLMISLIGGALRDQTNT